MQASPQGFCGAHTNNHPDLDKWLLTQRADATQIRERLLPFLASSVPSARSIAA